MAVGSDIPDLLPLVAAYCEADQHDFFPVETAAALDELIGNDAYGCIWVACNGDALCGYAVMAWGYSLEIHGREAVLDELFVDVKYRSQGIGRTLIETAFDDARQRGIRRVFLETEAANTAARELYLHLGFSLQDSIWMSRTLMNERDAD